MADHFINTPLVSLARDRDTLIVYPHAQRTGGRTMRSRVLAAVFGEQAVYNNHYFAAAKEWHELNDDDLKGFRAFTDIFNYSEPKFRRPFVLLGLVRDPVYRAVSFYFYVRGRAKHAQHALANETTLEEYFRQGSKLKAKYHSNVQCMRICGHASADMAIELIRRRYVGVGLTGKIAEFVDTVGPLLGWPSLAIQHMPPDSERYMAMVTADYRDMVLEQNREDLRLYETVAGGNL